MVFNRRLTNTVTAGGSNVTVLTNQYDTTTAATSSGASYLFDAADPVPMASRGRVISSATPAVTTTYSYYDTGAMYTLSDTDGGTMTQNRVHL
jgi:hypothetical protein